jgi:hypothetical protein
MLLAKYSHDMTLPIQQTTITVDAVLLAYQAAMQAERYAHESLVTLSEHRINFEH